MAPEQTIVLQRFLEIFIILWALLPAHLLSWCRASEPQAEGRFTMYMTAWSQDEDKAETTRQDFYSLDNRRLYALRLYQRAHERHGIKDKLARA